MGPSGAQGRWIVTIRSLCYLWDRAGQSKAVVSSSTEFDVTVIICSFDRPGFSLHECIVFVARILTFSFTLFDSRTKWRKPLASLVCCRNSLLVVCLRVWDVTWWRSPFLYWFSCNVGFSTGGRNLCLQPAELYPGCDCPWSGVRHLDRYFMYHGYMMVLHGYIWEWWDVVLVIVP